MPTKYKQKHKATYDLPEARQIAEQDAKAQAKSYKETAAVHSNEVLADIDEALQGLDEDLGVTFLQKGGQ